MPRIPDEPLRKVTLNLYEEDVVWFQQKYGQGYTELIRMAVHDYIILRERTTSDEQ